MKNGRKQDRWHFSSTGISTVALLWLSLFVGCGGHGIYVINDPLNADEHNDLAVIYEGQGKYELAVEHYNKAIRMDSDNPLYRTNRGNVLIKTGNVEGALKDFEKALEIDPDNVDGVNNLCFTRATRGYPLYLCPELIEKQLGARKVLPWQFYDTAGLVYLRQGMTDRAREMFDKALSHCSECSEEEIESLNERILKLAEG